eukprot:TRINITY_DN20913_c0_g1_i3.p1 TRINITY_DN20913_c0_g1~~TRINITY_DN20913_c0_g1_i3.p1  ORF type:complete len:386 (+),score=51.02 TRINITY_DN20913_c0_g1_i3:161-1318(+)
MGSLTLGILFMASSGLGAVLQLVVSKVMQSAGWPYYKMLAMSAGLASGVFATLAGLSKAPMPERRSIKWILMRGIASNGMLGSMIAAVQLGASTGDVAALGSVNTVFAAMLGRMFLGEPLHLSHMIAVLCCITGGVLISKPEFLFGASSSEVPIIAYLMAVFGGLWSAVIAISARKAGKASPWLLNTSATSTGAVAFAILPFTPLVAEPDLSDLHGKLHLSGLWILVNVLLMILGIGCTTLGAMMCPAALSATVNVSARITLGYLADLLIFGGSMDPLSICGAALMLSAVLAMALARKPAAESTPPELESPEAGGEQTSAGAEDETNSLASFVAAEFASEQGYQESIRHRRPAAAGPASPVTPPSLGWERTLFGAASLGPAATRL